MVSNSIFDCKKSFRLIDNKRKEGLCYVFLDEIQEIDGWALACKTLRLHNVFLFIMGSNSKILLKEFTKEFSGRYISFRIRPFVYKELLEYSGELDVTYGITDYLVWGGFPKLLEFPDLNDRIVYLNSIYNSIVNKDLIVHFNIKNTLLFKKIANYVLKSNARVFSARSIEKYLKNEHGIFRTSLYNR